MSTRGYGVGGGVGFAKELTYGTPVDPAVFLPYLSESLVGSSPIVQSGTITSDRSIYKNLAGPRSGAGDVAFEVDGQNLGLPLWFANGSASGAYAAAGLTGLVTAAPTGSATTAGSLPTGVYRIRVQSIWQRDDMADSGEPGEFCYLPVSAELQLTTSSGTQTLTLGWTDPSTLTLPLGWTYYGTAVFRSLAGGASGSEKFLAFVSGTTHAYVDNGSVTIAADAAGTMSGSIYQHTYTRAFQTGSNPLPGFSTTIVKDNDVSEQFMGCRSNGLDCTWNNGDAPVQSKWSMMARDFRELANPTISIANIRKMMSWQATVGIDGEFDETIEGLSISLANNTELVPGLSGIRRRRDVGYGARVITGSIARGFQDHFFWRKMRAAERFSIRCLTVGAPISDTAKAIPLGGGAFAYPISYWMTWEVFGCMLEGAGASVSGPGRLVESVQFKTEVDASVGTELRVRLFNLTSDYAA